MKVTRVELPEELASLRRTGFGRVVHDQQQIVGTNALLFWARAQNPLFRVFLTMRLHDSGRFNGEIRDSTVKLLVNAATDNMSDCFNANEAVFQLIRAVADKNLPLQIQAALAGEEMQTFRMQQISRRSQKKTVDDKVQQLRDSLNRAAEAWKIKLRPDHQQWMDLSSKRLGSFFAYILVIALTAPDFIYRLIGSGCMCVDGEYRSGFELPLCGDLDLHLKGDYSNETDDGRAKRRGELVEWWTGIIDECLSANHFKLGHEFKEFCTTFSVRNTQT